MLVLRSLLGVFASLPVMFAEDKKETSADTTPSTAQNWIRTTRCGPNVMWMHCGQKCGRNATKIVGNTKNCMILRIISQRITRISVVVYESTIFCPNVNRTYAKYGPDVDERSTYVSSTFGTPVHVRPHYNCPCVNATEYYSVLVVAFVILLCLPP